MLMRSNHTWHGIEIAGQDRSNNKQSTFLDVHLLSTMKFFTADRDALRSQSGRASGERASAAAHAEALLDQPEARYGQSETLPLNRLHCFRPAQDTGCQPASQGARLARADWDARIARCTCFRAWSPCACRSLTFDPVAARRPLPAGLRPSRGGRAWCAWTADRQASVVQKTTTTDPAKSVITTLLHSPKPFA